MIVLQWCFLSIQAHTHTLYMVQQPNSVACTLPHSLPLTFGAIFTGPKVKGFNLMSPQCLHAWEMQKPRLSNFCLFEQEHYSSEQQPNVNCSTYCSFEHLGGLFEQPSTPYFAQLFAPFSFMQWILSIWALFTRKRSPFPCSNIPWTCQLNQISVWNNFPIWTPPSCGC